MRTALFSLLFLAVLTGCKETQTDKAAKSEPTSDAVRYTGDYIHIGEAAVLSTSKEIYAIQIDDRSAALDKKAKEFQNTAYDMVSVVVTGELIPNPFKEKTGEGWDQMLKIDKIIEVNAADVQSVIQTPTQEQEDN